MESKEIPSTMRVNDSVYYHHIKHIVNGKTWHIYHNQNKERAWVAFNFDTNESFLCNPFARITSVMNYIDNLESW